MRILKTVGIAGSVAALLLATPVAFAETQTVTGGTDSSGTGFVQEQKRDRAPIDPAMQVKMRREAQLQNTMEKNRPVVDAARAQEKMRLNAENATSTLRDGKAAKERMEAAREEAKKRVEAQREKNEHRLSEIKDKAKQEKAQGLAKQFAHINKQWTDHFMDVLDRLDAIIKKVQGRADIAAASGKDVTATTAAIQSAKTAIETARAAVVTQAAKVYELNTSTSTAVVAPTASTTTPGGQNELVQNLRTAFKALHASLFKDLTTLRDGPILAARRAVQAAVQSLIKIPGINGGTATTTTATTTTATSTATTTAQ